MNFKRTTKYSRKKVLSIKKKIAWRTVREMTNENRIWQAAHS